MIQLRRWRRPDGGYRFKGEDSVHAFVATAIWLFLIAHLIFGVA